MTADGSEVLRYAAFTQDPAGGNPAGVVLDSALSADAEMLAIAAEVGYSETAFAGPLVGGRCPVRYFSPEVEVPFCGHATIATAVAIGEGVGPGRLVFATAAGDVPVDVRLEGGVLSACLTSVPTTSRPATDRALTDALAGLRWSSDDLHPDLPVHVAYGGAHHLIVPVAERDTLRSLDYEFERLRAACVDHGWTTVHLTWPERPDRWHVRQPFPLGGVVEDAATGAAAAAFGGYLRVLDLVPPTGTVDIHQGDDMGRPSRLRLDLPSGTDRSLVTGHAVRMAG